jgi:hypothetical protein
MQNIATERLLVRASAGTGDVEELTGAQAGTVVFGTRIDVASAATVDLSGVTVNNINITGTTTITGFTVASGRTLFVRFNASLTLTNNANIVTQSGANIVTQAGDTCILRATAANVVEVLSYREGRWGAVPGTAPMYACRAWVNFNGTGTVAIRASGNVSSITDNGTGDYTVNFTTAMPDVNYSGVKSDSFFSLGDIRVFNTNNVTVRVYENFSTPVDTSIVCVAIFR